MRLALLLLLPFLLVASERIIALSPSISEIIFALGKGDELVGVSEYSLWPKEVQKITKVGGYSNPSLERIISLNPTLVIGQGKYSHTVNQLKALEIKTLSLQMKTIENIKEAIRAISAELDCDPTPLISPIDEAIEEVKTNRDHNKEAVQSDPKRVLIIYGLSLDINRGMYIAGHNIFYEDIIKLAGAENAFTGDILSQPVIHYEGLLELNPDIVILIHQETTDGKISRQKAKELWYNIPINASKNKKIYIMQKTYLSIPSHRVAQSIRDIAGVIIQ